MWASWGPTMIRVFVLAFLFSPFVFAQINSNVIYGDDDRTDYYELTDPDVVYQTRASVLLVKNTDILPFAQGLVELKNKALGQNKNYCPTERFLRQPTAGFCSGFLVANNIVATAGHCIRDQISCDESSVAFNYHMASQSYEPTILDENAVYQCKRLIVSKTDTSGADFALIEIEPANGIPFLTIDVAKPVQGDTFRVIGYPLGLPLKVAGNGKFRSNSTTHFTAALDTYNKNSGSPVINEKTGSVVGILVRGENDHTNKDNCLASKVCAEDECKGEDVTYISYIIPYLQSLLTK